MTFRSYQEWYNGAPRTQNCLPTEADSQVQLHKRCSGNAWAPRLSRGTEDTHLAAVCPPGLWPARSRCGVGVLCLEHTRVVCLGQRVIVRMLRTESPHWLRFPPQPREETRACQRRGRARQLCPSLSWSLAGTARAADAFPRSSTGISPGMPASAALLLLSAHRQGSAGGREGCSVQSWLSPPCCSGPPATSNCVWEKIQKKGSGCQRVSSTVHVPL